MAVAIWDHRPSADELLAARVAAGWRPTPTATRAGDVILGHAACLSAQARAEPDPSAD
ncbi:MAG: hypothetical protein R3A79_13075 [Nannocystaceae bacterium]